MTPRIATLAILISLTGCATQESSDNLCRNIKLPEYSKAQVVQLGNEVAEAPLSLIWPKFVKDYMSIYDDLSLCKGLK